MRTKNTKLMAYSILLLSTSLLLGYIESIFPINIGQVGIKIGLSNIVTILGLKTIGYKRTIVINVLRLVILGVLFGNLVRFILSVSGFIFSFFTMCVFIYALKVGIKISSIFGSIAHNIGQFFALVFILSNNKILYLIPIYILIGIGTGLIVGVISDIIYKRLSKIKIE